MKKFMLSLVLLAGCASPAADYVRADKAAWDVYDAPTDDGKTPGQPRIDKWVDGDASLSDDVKDAMHQLNAGRRVRISHAIAAIGS